MPVIQWGISWSAIGAEALAIALLELGQRKPVILRAPRLDLDRSHERSDAAGAFALKAPVGRRVTVMVCAPSPPGASSVFDRGRAVASIEAVAGGTAIELVLPQR